MADTLAVPTQITDQLQPGEQVQAMVTGAGQRALAATNLRILSADGGIPLAAVVSVASTGNSLTGGALSIRSGECELRVVGVPFDQVQRFAAVVRSGVARVRATSWVPHQRRTAGP
ncbi:MAG: hypothetical protein JOZ47_14515 [Kutzneria sp.]|nr:hypothetical protein [Kutzneria sp.]